MTPEGKWKFAIDRGGTFTDLVALSPQGLFHTLKILSSSREYKDPSIEAMRRVLGLLPNEPLPHGRITSIRLGTTVATNAILERTGGPVTLLITKGFRDLLEIGYQSRPDIFALDIKKPEQFYSNVLEVDERIDSRGRVVSALDVSSLRERIEGLREDGSLGVVAIVLMHSWKNPAHEIALGRALEDMGAGRVFLSHESVNLINIITRGQSTMVDAYLSLILAEYTDSIESETGPIPVEFMKSSGGLTSAGEFLGKDALYSGPAGGVIATAQVADSLGLDNVLGFDMGGTSTDVCRYDGTFDKVYEKQIAGIELQGEVLNILTVASGGGSVLSFNGTKMTVGPHSAGARPGPASYGLGGPLTITDANLLLSRITANDFPKTFGPAGDAPLDTAPVVSGFTSLTKDINKALGLEMTPHEVASGFIDIANEKMALAIREVSVARGFDVRTYSLLAFGGAGGQHACALADLLGIDRIVSHPFCSVMSAYGLAHARVERSKSKGLLCEFTRSNYASIQRAFVGLKAEVEQERTSTESYAEVSLQIALRPAGSNAYLTIEWAGFDQVLDAFRVSYKKLFGFFPATASVEAVNLRATLSEQGHATAPYGKAVTVECPADVKTTGSVGRRDIYYDKKKTRALVFLRRTLVVGKVIKGPALIVDSTSTLLVAPGFEASLKEAGHVLIKRSGAVLNKRVKGGEAVDPVLLEVFGNIFASVGAQMGVTLRKTAFSVNIKERLDFSCALFDSSGALVANAAHIPVHLGSMADTVAGLALDLRSTMRSGDIYISNNPYRGGSHLPDITLIRPVFLDNGDLIYFTAVRGHHADIGGITPGSMPANASNIAQEGLLLDNLLILRDNRFFEDKLRGLFEAGPYPVRNVDESLLDIKAQIAAVLKGESAMRGLISRYGWPVVNDYMGFVQDDACAEVRRLLTSLCKDGDSFEAFAEDTLDDLTPIKVFVRITRSSRATGLASAVVDFSGSGPEHAEDNLNAPLSVTRSAVLYVLRLLSRGNMALNSGCLRPVEIIVPERSLLNPAYPAPVSSGNVETSQRIVDVLLKAFDAQAASQGTMNNLLFEIDGETPYYETIGGGSGATSKAPGASGVQVHMTNTRMTDPEVLEVKHRALRLKSFSLRSDSGGKGLYNGGDGLVRELEFLKDAHVTIISERRLTRPYGLAGGGSGKAGENLIRRVDGKVETLGHRVSLELKAGEGIIIKTPGGGGWGRA